MRKAEMYERESYLRHIGAFDDYKVGKKFSNWSASWKREDTIDWWRHKRLYDAIDPLIRWVRGSKWLTVGDGRYGRDAHVLKMKGLEVLASDISETLLIEAKQSKYIDKYSAENAENLSFENEQFDYVFCKESYHHFPRPMIGLYEMLRVAKSGVILIEPSDMKMVSLQRRTIGFFVGYFISKILKVFISKINVEDDFEPIGGCNYIYTISEREIVKVAMGLNLNWVAFKGINDYYIEGGEFEKCSSTSRMFRKMKSMIWKKNILCALRIQDFTFKVAIIFKNNPTPGMLKDMKAAGFVIENLPVNPYRS